MNIDSIDDGVDFNWKFWLICLLVVAAVFLAMLPKWMRGDEARAVLQTAGYTDVKLQGFVFLSCGEDLFGMGFQAKGPTGKPAAGAVCKGIFKGATVRLKAD
jgi:hypothetical protein